MHANYYQTCRSKCNRKSIFDLDATEENRYGKIVAKEKLKKHNKSLRRERKERKDEGPKMSRLNSTISQFRIGSKCYDKFHDFGITCALGKVRVFNKEQNKEQESRTRKIQNAIVVHLLARFS